MTIFPKGKKIKPPTDNDLKEIEKQVNKNITLPLSVKQIIERIKDFLKKVLK